MSHPFLENRKNGPNRDHEYKSTILHLVNWSRGWVLYSASAASSEILKASKVMALQ